MTKESVEKLKLPVSVGVAVTVLLFCFGIAYKVGAEQESVKRDVAANGEQILSNRDRVEICNGTITGMQLQMNDLKNNQEHIIEALQEIKQEIKELPSKQ